MTNFKKYAKYYDILNQEKDYDRESDYIDGLIKMYTTDARSILELGSGTGIHAVSFSSKGYEVRGIDISNEMVEIANQKINNHQNLNKLSFTQGDIRNIRLSNTFDVILSLFHVMSYQTTNRDIEQVFSTAYNHLNTDGIFMFDFWHGPGVLTDPPAVRVKQVNDDQVKIYRIAEPVMYSNENKVDVHYNMIIMNEKTKEYMEINEVHSMRYFFLPELKIIAEKNGFQFLNAYHYLTTNELSYQSWNGCILFKKVDNQ